MLHPYTCITRDAQMVLIGPAHLRHVQAGRNGHVRKVREKHVLQTVRVLLGHARVMAEPASRPAIVRHPASNTAASACGSAGVVVISVRSAST